MRNGWESPKISTQKLKMAQKCSEVQGISEEQNQENGWAKF